MKRKISLIALLGSLLLASSCAGTIRCSDISKPGKKDPPPTKGGIMTRGYNHY